MVIRHLQSADADEWHRMRLALWPDETMESLARHPGMWAAENGGGVVIVADREAAGRLAGFAEISTRPYADGCDTSPVPYLEGWFVDPDARRLGVGSALVRAAEQWAREQGYEEFASDALLDNDTSHRAHHALGFIEIEKAIHYAKKL